MSAGPVVLDRDGRSGAVEAAGDDRVRVQTLHAHNALDDEAPALGEDDADEVG